MKNYKRIAAGALAAAAVLVPSAARADTPYAQASAKVEMDGSVSRSKHISDVWHVSKGTYCVAVDEHVNLDGAVAVHATPVGLYNAARTLSVEVGGAPCGWGRDDIIAVYSRVASRVPADTAFYLTVS
ncbi:hypothetical protein SAMN05444920_12277 [Nonomuraea solani]|uniref:Uncharacterized protein n=1 Tax=Nonomuraea solani TaxID=1144553 RepID=A0A1H6EXY5_9ACTN|nr:hypothetical protein [Nonomuraea solani]SEH01826.1 hypothetical protein SAMN05444920_12277 [Nonomuraea solani]